MAKYLKDILVEKKTPIDFEFVTRSELLTKQKRDGGTYQIYEYSFLTRVDSQLHKENIFPEAHDAVLCRAVKGDLCRAELEKGKWVKWSILPRGEAALDIPTPPVSRQNSAERAVTASDKAQKERETRISLAGLMQAHICAGKTNQEALAEALLAKDMLDKAAAVLASQQ